MVSLIEKIAEERCVPWEVAEIAVNFRKKYEQGQTQEELQTECCKALERLHQYSGCLNELDQEGILQVKAGSPSTLARYLTTLRWMAEQIPLNEINTLYREKFNYDTGKTIREPYPLANAIFKLTTAQRGKRKAAVDQKLVLQHSYPRRFRADDVIDKACELLEERQHPNRVAAGLLLLTGRRTIEIFRNAEFEILGSRTLRFSGQAKTKDSSQSRDNYEIPVLVDPYTILDALEWLRERQPCEGLTSEQVNRRVARNLNNACKVAYEKPGLLEDVTPHDLRAAYAEICWNYYHGGKTGYNAFFAEILGHSKNDIVTALRYKKFELI
jgi:integrase